MLELKLVGETTGINLSWRQALRLPYVLRGLNLPIKINLRECGEGKTFDFCYFDIACVRCGPGAPNRQHH